MDDIKRLPGRGEVPPGIGIPEDYSLGLVDVPAACGKRPCHQLDDARVGLNSHDASGAVVPGQADVCASPRSEDTHARGRHKVVRRRCGGVVEEAPLLAADTAVDCPALVTVVHQEDVRGQGVGVLEAEARGHVHVRAGHRIDPAHRPTRLRQCRRPWHLGEDRQGFVGGGGRSMRHCHQRDCRSADADDGGPTEPHRGAGPETEAGGDPADADRGNQSADAEDR